MKWALTFVFVVLIFAGLGLWFVKDPGHVEITWIGFEYQSTAVMSLIIFTCFFFLLIFSVSLLAWIFKIPRLVKTYFYKSKESKADDVLLALFTSYEAEMFNEALDHKKKAATTLSSNPYFLWFSGNVHLKLSNFLEAGQCFFELTKKPSTTFLGLKGAIRSALHYSDFKGAYALLEQAEKIVPKSTWVLKHYLAIARDRKDYKKAEELIRRLDNLGRLTPEQSKRQIGHLLYEQAFDPDTSVKDKEALLRQAHFLDPAHVETTVALAKLLYHDGHKKASLSVLEATWVLSPDQNLGELYLMISESQNELEAFQIATKLVQKSKKSPISLLFLSQVALKAKLWGEARDCLNELLKQNSSAKVYELMAKLELEEHQDIRAALKWLDASQNVSRETFLG